jgi:hypothetical protein
VGFVTYNEGRLFAYILGLKEPRFIAAYGDSELDPALMRGEIRARATGANTVVQRNREWLEKGAVNFHAIMEVPKGDKHPQLSHIPEIDSFAKSELDRKLIVLTRSFRIAGTPFVVPPGTLEGPCGDVTGRLSQDLSGPPSFLRNTKG